MSGLFTVLIAEKEHIDAIQQGNKLFFEPFLENKELAFCYWNPAGQNLEDSVPGLLDAVGCRKAWRAVIIHNCTEDLLKTRNPFDVVDCSAVGALAHPGHQPDEGEDLSAWEERLQAYFVALSAEKNRQYKDALSYPLQKLSTWLCFKPEDYVLNNVQEKQDVHDWAMKEIGRDSEKASARLEWMEREQYKHDIRTKEMLRREFCADNHLNISHPSEVHCISLRDAEQNFFDPDAFWNVHQESSYSAFADRNMYFDKMRFMVFDLLARDHRNFRTDYIRFLASVLIFISNPIPSSAMQARRLYHLEVETDDTPLRALVTSYDRKLAATADVIKNEMDQIRSEIPEKLTDKAAEAIFCTPKDVSVLLDASCDPEKVQVDTDYGLFYDYPENEHQKWNRDFQVSKTALSYIVKQQARSVRKSVDQWNLTSENLDMNASRLTTFQLDDIRDYTETAENEMVSSIPASLTDISRYTDRMQQAANDVSKTISSRMTKRTTLVLSSLCLGLYVFSMLPFLISNGSTTRNLTNTLILSGIMLGVLAFIMFVTLIFLCLSVRKSIRAYNDVTGGIMHEIQSALKQVSRYLSASCNVRRGNAVQDYATKNLDEYTMGLRIRTKHLEDIRVRRAYLAEDYRDYFGDRSLCEEAMVRPYEYDFDLQTEYAYPAPFLAGETRQIDFVSNGNLVSVPSSYVKRILVRLEGIYE